MRDAVPGFGGRVRELREARGWTQAQLAERAGTHFTSVSKVEAGDRSVSLRLALLLADALGVPISRLVPADWRGRAGGPDESPAAEKATPTAGAKKRGRPPRPAAGAKGRKG